MVRSTDGGQTWTPVTFSIPWSGMNAISTPTPSSATIVGNQGLQLQTNDNGTTWTQTWIPDFAHRTALTFSDPLNGVNTSPGAIYRTSDGGLTWTQEWFFSLLHYSPRFNSVAVHSPNTTVAVGSLRDGPVSGAPDWWPSGLRVSTSDGGTTWDDWWPTFPLNAVTIHPTGLGFIVGDGGTLHKTVDGGAVFERIAGAEYYSGIINTTHTDFFDRDNGIMVSGFSTIFGVNPSRTTFFYTHNGGQTWSPSTVPGKGLNDVAFSQSSTAYAVGDAIYKTTNGGATWLLVDANGGLNAVAFAQPDHGIAVGEGGLVVRLDNDVVTPVPSGTTASLLAVSMPDPATAVAVGDDGIIIRSDDGGATWVSQISGTTNLLRGVCFNDPMTGTAVGETGVILETSDGGATWNIQTSGVTLRLNGVSFSDAANGMVVGYPGAILSTSDGGATWIVEPSPTTYMLEDVAFFDAANITVTGSGETILARRLAPVPVFFHTFTATPQNLSVKLTWSIVADERVQGFRLYRRPLTDARPSLLAFVGPEQRAFVDQTPHAGTRYEYTLAALLADGSETLSAPVTTTIQRVGLELSQNQPNPFNPQTLIHYTVPTDGHVQLSIYDARGAHVITLVNGMEQAGSHEVYWNGRDGNGNRVGSGVYFCRLRAGSTVVSRKMVLLK